MPEEAAMGPWRQTLLDPRLWFGAAFVTFQYWILFNPQQPLLERPAHLMLALFLVFLWCPLRSERLPPLLRQGIDLGLLASVLAVSTYY
jgi:hypothetical protein